jgi:hypothetical protein
LRDFLAEGEGVGGVYILLSFLRRVLGAAEAPGVRYREKRHVRTSEYIHCDRNLIKTGASLE